jgi:YfiH family protein
VAVDSHADEAYIVPDWPAPPHIKAVATTRYGGVSVGELQGLNLADYVGDEPKSVAVNRDRLMRTLSLPEEPRWLTQVHGPVSVCADQIAGRVEADAAWTASTGIVCAVLTADCLPILLCDRDGRQVAAVHAGWRGLCSGVIELAVERFFAADIPATNVMAWLGPAIGPASYEVDSMVRNAFIDRMPACAASFIESRPGHWYFDLYAAAREVLAAIGVTAISGDGFCTYTDERLYSFRRNNSCGRQATLIWREKH